MSNALSPKTAHAAANVNPPKEQWMERAGNTETRAELLALFMELVDACGKPSNG